MSKQHIREQPDAYSSFLKIKMKEPEHDPRRTKKGICFYRLIETRRSTPSFYSLKETQASANRDFHGPHPLACSRLSVNGDDHPLAKLRVSRPAICISLNKNSNYCYIPRSSKHIGTCKWLGRVFCNRSHPSLTQQLE